MNVIRRRRWMGEHPAWAINLAGALAGAIPILVMLATFFSIYQLSGETIPVHLLDTYGLSVWPTILVCFTVYMVTTIRGRAGLPTRRILLALPWVPAVAGLWCILLAGTIILIDGLIQPVLSLPGAPPVNSVLDLLPSLAVGLKTLAIFTGQLVVAEFIGWAIGNAVTRRQIRRGKWEVTRPAKLRTAAPLWAGRG